VPSGCLQAGERAPDRMAVPAPCLPGLYSERSPSTSGELHA
jgi:hypothetical protein